LFKPDPYLRGLYISAVVDAFAWGSGSAILYGMLVKTYGFNTYQLGLMSTVLSLSWAITQIPIGKLADIYGRKIFLMASEVIGAGALIGWMISTDFTSFLILQILYGVVISTWVPTTIALLTDLAPEDIKGEAMGRLQIFRGILSFPAPFIGGILYDIWGFRAPLLLNLLGAISALFLINLLIHEEKQ
jgi:MFS family permease